MSLSNSAPDADMTSRIETFRENAGKPKSILFLMGVILAALSIFGSFAGQETQPGLLFLIGLMYLGAGVFATIQATLASLDPRRANQLGLDWLAAAGLVLGGVVYFWLAAF